MKLILNRFWPLIFVLIIWFIFASPYFIKGFVPYPSKYQVTFFHPWSVYEKWWGPVKNNAMPDIVSQIYPWKYFTVSSLKNGEIPFWNPYSFAGNPHVANFQSAVFSPFNILFLLLPFIDSWTIMILLQPVLAGIFTLIYLRYLKVSKAGSVIGAVIFMFCGFNVVWMAYGTLSMAIIFLPLALFGIEKAFTEKKTIYFALFSISLIISIFSGHIQTSFYFILLCVSYLLFKLLTTRDRRVFLISLFFLFLGFGISLLQIIPTFKLLQLSSRNDALYQGGGIPLHYLITMFAPDFYGNPVTRNDWYGTYAEWSSFVGIIPLILSSFTLFNRKNNQIYFFSIAGITALLFSTDSVFHTILKATALPIFATSIPSRIIVLFSFSIAILSAYGYEFLIKSLNEKTYSKIFTAILALTGLLLLIWLGLLFNVFLPPDKNIIATKNLLLPSVLFSAFCSLMCINKIVGKKIIIKFSVLLIVLFVSFDSIRFASKWMPTDDKNLVYPDLPVISAMQKNIGNGRVFGNIGNEVASYYRLSSIEGYDPLFIKRYGEFMRFASTGEWSEAERSVAKLDRRSDLTTRVLNLLSVNLIYHPIADTNTSWAYPVWDKKNEFRLIYADDKFQLYKNNNALPRASLFYSYEVIRDEEKILKRIFEPSFNFNNTIILEKELPYDLRNFFTVTSSNKNSELSRKGTANMISNSTNKITLQVDTGSPALLYLSDNFYPSWKAYVNNTEAEIYRANYTFRAVVVPAGKSLVEFTIKDYF